MLISSEYKRLMQTRDPVTSKFSHTNNPLNTVSVKQPVALQSGIGQGGTLNRDMTKSSGFRVQNQLSMVIGGHSNQPSVAQIAKNKRPVSCHSHHIAAQKSIR